MYLPKTYKPYKKHVCLLRIDGIIRVFTFSHPKFHRVQCKFEDPFSAGRLTPIPLTSLTSRTFIYIYILVQLMCTQTSKDHLVLLVPVDSRVVKVPVK